MKAVVLLVIALVLVDRVAGGAKKTIKISTIIQIAEYMKNSWTCASNLFDIGLSVSSEDEWARQERVGQFNERFMDHDREEVIEHIKQNGIKDLKEFVEKKKREWNDIPLHFGITGSPGAGKSSFINSLRDMNGDDVGAAPVGVTETTMEPKPYPDPKNDKLVYWDLPGIGTPNFPLETYLERVQFRRYDVFIIFSANRFTDDTLVLAKEIKKMNKSFFFSRTKIDADLYNDKHAHPRTHDETKLLERVRQNCRSEFKKAGIKQERVYLISNHHKDMFDFPDLIKDVIEALPGAKKAAMALTLSSTCKRSLGIKREHIMKTIWQASALSAAGSMVPIPGVSMTFDIALLLKEVNFYKEQFGLDSRTLDTLSLMMDIERMIKERESFAEIINIGKHFVLKKMAHVASVKPFLRAASFYGVNMIGPSVVASLSFGATCGVLMDALLQIEGEAQFILDQVMQMSSK